MRIPEGKRGLLIFGLITVALLGTAVVAFLVTGPMGIEDRFTAAAGIAAVEDGDSRNDTASFSIEGNSILYVFVLGILIAACMIIYHRNRI
jgi:hypothetical protein